MTLRRIVRLFSFMSAIVIVLGCSAISGYSLANRYKQNLEYGYKRAMNDLSDYISNIEITLTKGVYANTAPQQYGISAKLMSETNGAKAALAQLPLTDVELDNVNKFIAQVGDFSSYLSTNSSKGQNITDEQMDNFRKLGEYARKLNSDIKDIMARFDDGNLSIGDAFSAEHDLSNDTKNLALTTVASGFREMNEGFTDYPTLIYDGPFSDHILQTKPKLIQNEKAVTKEEARSIAARYLNIDAKRLAPNEDTNGNMPTYNFGTDNISVSVTKAGGRISYILDSRNIQNATLNYSQAAARAEEFMKSHSIESMKESYYVINNGICTINYAYEKDGIIYYSDLIKIGVALDDGDIVLYNATGYIMNHTDRKIPANIISIEKARESVSKNLNIISENKAYVPTSGLNEVLCYEFRCTGENDDQVLVYINAQTGYEEQIFIMLMSDGGIVVI